MDKVYLGVPCSATDKQSLFPCTREDEAVAIAFGIKLCGVDVSVFMQNSGLGHCADIITSLLIPYGIEIPMEIFKGSENPQHQQMNKIFLQLIGVLYATS